MKDLARESFLSFRYTARYLWAADGLTGLYATISLVWQLIEIGCSLLTPYILGMLIESLSNATAVRVTQWLVVSYAASWFMGQLIERTQLWLIVQTSERALVSAKSDFISACLRQPLNVALRLRSGEVVGRLQQLEEAFPKLLNGIYFQIIPLSLRIISVIILAAYSFGVVYGLCFIFCFFGYLVVTLLGSRKTYDMQDKQYKIARDFSSNVIDVLRNIPLVKMYQTEAVEAGRISKSLIERRKIITKLYGKMQRVSVIQVAIIASGLFIICLLASGAFYGERLSVGRFVQLNAYLLQFTLPASYFGYMVLEVQRSIAAISDVITATPREHPTSNGDATIDPTSKRGCGVRGQDLTFWYKQSDTTLSSYRPALRNVCFDIKEGEFVAVVGASGSGKSSLLKLLISMYVPSHGTILFDNIELERYNRNQLVAAIGYVAQEPMILDRSLRENISYGASGNVGNIYHLIAAVGLHDALEKLDSGLETRLGEGGERLSGGERQRIAIARALVEQRRLYLFDESTSALDAVSEKLIWLNVAEACRGATVLVVSHRLTSITHADKILVMEDGELVESGRHLELLRNDGAYARLWAAQEREHC